MLPSHSSINHMTIIEDWIAQQKMHYQQCSVESRDTFSKRAEDSLYENSTNTKFPNSVDYECKQNNGNREESTSYESTKEMLEDVDAERYLPISHIYKKNPEDVQTGTCVFSQPYQIYTDSSADQQKSNDTTFDDKNSITLEQINWNKNYSNIPVPASIGTHSKAQNQHSSELEKIQVLRVDIIVSGEDVDHQKDDERQQCEIISNNDKNDEENSRNEIELETKLDFHEDPSSDEDIRHENENSDFLSLFPDTAHNEDAIDLTIDKELKSYNKSVHDSVSQQNKFTTTEVQNSSFGYDLAANLRNGFYRNTKSEEMNSNFPEAFTMNRHKNQENVYSNLLFPVPIHPQHDQHYSVPTSTLKGKKQNQNFSKLNTETSSANDFSEAVTNGKSTDSTSRCSQSRQNNILTSNHSYSNYCEILLQYYDFCYSTLLTKFEEFCNMAYTTIQTLTQDSSSRPSCQQSNRNSVPATDNNCNQNGTTMLPQVSTTKDAPKSNTSNQQNLENCKPPSQSTAGTQTDYVSNADRKSKGKFHASAEHNEFCSIRKYGNGNKIPKRMSLRLKRLQNKDEIPKVAVENQKRMHNKCSAVSNLPSTLKRKATNDINTKNKKYFENQYTIEEYPEEYWIEDNPRKINFLQKEFEYFNTPKIPSRYIHKKKNKYVKAP